MRVTMIVAALVLELLAQPAWAQGVTRTRLADGMLILYPGGAASECYDLTPGYLSIYADSPPGRTGEVAYLELTKTIDGADVSLMRSLVSQGQIDPIYSVEDRNAFEAHYGITGGHYCYSVTVTKTMDPMPADRPERPSKQVRLLITHRTNV
jgi:hypothetical protein